MEEKRKKRIYRNGDERDERNEFGCFFLLLLSLSSRFNCYYLGDALMLMCILYIVIRDVSDELISSNLIYRCCISYSPSRSSYGIFSFFSFFLSFDSLHCRLAFSSSYPKAFAFISYLSFIKRFSN